jgi:hypothetical protein
MARDGYRHATLEIDVGDVADAGRTVDLKGRGARQQITVASTSPEVRRLERRSRRARDHGLARLGRRFGGDRRVGGRSRDHQLAVSFPTKKKSNRSV